MDKLFYGLLTTFLLSQGAVASSFHKNISLPPQPTTCISSSWSSSGTSHWKNIQIVFKNNCTQAVDFQNSLITFNQGINLNTAFWGTFTPLSYPNSKTYIASEKLATNLYLASFNLQFPTGRGYNSILPVGRSFIVKYGASSEAHQGPANVYVSTPTSTGSLQITNTASQPANVSQSYALLHLISNNVKVADVQVPWKSSKIISSLAAAGYTLSSDNVTDSTGNTYQGTVVPASFTLTMNQVVQANVSYTMISQPGKITLSLQALPNALAGYTSKPTIIVTQVGGGASATLPLSWNTSYTLETLVQGKSYSFSTPMITSNGYECFPTFTPTTLVANSTNIPTTRLTYACNQVAQNSVALSIKGAPTSLATLKVTLTPNDGSAPITQSIALTNGTGTSTVKLPQGVVYTVSTDAVPGFNATFTPQPLPSVNQGVETITFTPQGTTPVGINGQLAVCDGKFLCNKDRQHIQLKGLSTHGLQWYGWGKCLTASSLNTLVNWGVNVIRISMYVQEGGYETNPASFTQQVNTLIDEATKRGLYAIVDFHMLNPGDPNLNFNNAKNFFTAIASAHTNNVNLLYEIANEPSGVTWAQIKSYAEKIIPVIRAVDAKTPIIVGTPGWSSLGISEGNGPQEIINNPVNASNIMYTFHFYAGSHKDIYYNALNTASNALPIFVTEFGEQLYTGDGPNDFAMTDKYLALMASKKIGWTKWNYSDDFRSGAIWKVGTCGTGQWLDSNLKPSGVYIKAKLQS